MLIQFCIFGIIGLIATLTFTSIKKLLIERVYELKGEASLLMFPIYGLIAVFYPIVGFRIQSLQWYARGIIYMIIFFIVQYVSGLIYRKLRICPWEYPSKYSVNGLIYFPYAPIWFFAGLGVEKIYPFVGMLSRAI